MNLKRIPDQALDTLLRHLGFTRKVVPSSHVYYKHPSSSVVVMLPLIKLKGRVLERHLLGTRLLLSESGLMEPDKFDRFIAKARRNGAPATR